VAGLLPADEKVKIIEKLHEFGPLTSDYLVLARTKISRSMRTRARLTTMNLNSHRWLLVAAACSLAGCSTIVSRDAHYTSNPNVIRLRDRTAVVHAKAVKQQLSWAESEKFLHESMGVAAVLRGMESWGRGDQETTASIERFETRLKSLLARGKPIRSSDAVDLGADVQQLDNQFRGRWEPSAEPADRPAETSEITDSTTACETDKDKKGKDKKRDRDGHRDRGDKKRDRDHCEDDDKKSDRR
jgi:hypothetical protein